MYYSKVTSYQVIKFVIFKITYYYKNRIMYLSLQSDPFIFVIFHVSFNVKKIFDNVLMKNIRS